MNIIRKKKYLRDPHVLSETSVSFLFTILIFVQTFEPLARDFMTVTFLLYYFRLPCRPPLPIKPLIVFKDRMSTF